MDESSYSENRLCASAASRSSDSESIADHLDFELLGASLGRDIESALQAALSDGAVFASGHDALVIFRKALTAFLCDIQSHPRVNLIKDFLLKGPYDSVEEIKTASVGQRLSDAETAAAIAFFFSGMFNGIKGVVAELLAAKPCVCLMRRLKKAGKLPRSARLYIGDSVRTHGTKGKVLLKGADLHILIDEYTPSSASRIVVAGVAEVKSYSPSERRLRDQLDRHLLRVSRGLRVGGVDYPTGKVTVGFGRDQGVALITVLPSNWKLPRSFRFQDSEGGRLLHVDTAEPPQSDDKISQTGNYEWRIALRWSQEALAEAAIEMTLWYMGRIGEVVFSGIMPPEWRKMTPTEAGRNAAKMMLYYAILRSRTLREEQRAIALYNSYGFGYALGMNFRDANGVREMLWPEDLDEIARTGSTKHGCSIWR